MACDEAVPAPEEIWLEMSAVIAKGSRCTRRQIGAILVKHSQVIAATHNGPQPESTRPFHCPRGALTYAEQPKDVGYQETGCVELHAEELALSRSTIDPRGATMYINDEPCQRCQYAMRACNITWVIRGVVKSPAPVQEFIS